LRRARRCDRAADIRRSNAVPKEASFHRCVLRHS
jgi:hypothetical protein